MRAKTTGVLILVLAACGGVFWLGPRPAAVGQAPAPAPRWEYKVQKIVETEIFTGEAERILNRLGADGWEYVEPLYKGTPPLTNGIVTQALFRRPKR
jgi:hypothetical protein